MSCNLDRELLIQYIDDAIDPLEKIIIEEHIKDCDICKEEIRVFRALEDNLNTYDFSYDVPDSMNNMIELLTDNLVNMENCKNENNTKLSIIETFKSIYSLSTNYKNNPYNNKINEEIEKSINSIATPIKNRIKKKVMSNKKYKKKNSLIKLLKIV